MRESQLVHTQQYYEGDIMGGAHAAFFSNLLAKLLGMLRQQPPGQYMLTHAPGADFIACLKAEPGNDARVCACLPAASFSPPSAWK